VAEGQKKRISLEDFFEKILVELPALSASEMDQGHFIQKKLFLQADLDMELLAMRVWYVSQALYGALIHRGNVELETTLEILRLFAEAKDALTGNLGLDYKLRCEFYERALQHDLEDESHGNQLLDCFLKFCGSEHDALKELYYASMVGITTRLAKTVERFEIVRTSGDPSA
jgi:hypothetical protein